MNNQMNEQTYVAKNGVSVIYRHKPRKYDFNHVIFVFSGFLNAKPGNYDFINALSDCPCDVIWISDNFEDMYAYYLCADLDFKIEKAVSEFISIQIDELGLTKKNVTVTGFSKGGSAALYYGLKLNIPNIVTSVPQLYIGRYVQNYWQVVATHMLGDNFSADKVRYLDNYLIRLLKEDDNLSKNIYLLTSEYDKQYHSEIEPHLQDFSKYNNFNLIKTYSMFVREHNQVTGHHTALLLSIYYALANGAIPRFNNDGKVNFFGSQPVARNKPSKVPFVDLRRIEVKNNRLFLDGVGLLRGIPVEDYSDIDYELILKGKKTYKKALAKAHRPGLTRELFENEFVAYDKCCFTTYQYKGIDITDIDKGKYTLFLRIKVKGNEVETKITSKKLINIEKREYSYLCDKSILEIRGNV